jgi:deoxyadenosine/deoxycytidine kinase
VVIGVCAAGKSTLARGLRELGYDAKTAAQEHSYVPDMWQRLSRPQVLIYLDASFETIRQRRAVSYGPRDVEEQRRRVAHARAHCHIYIDTNPLSIAQVLAEAVRQLPDWL